MAARGEHNLANSAARSSASRTIWSGSAPTVEPFPRHPGGMAEWKSRPSGRRFPIAIVTRDPAGALHVGLAQPRFVQPDASGVWSGHSV